MDGARRPLLSGACLAFDQHRRVALRELLERGQRIDESGRAADEAHRRSMLANARPLGHLAFAMRRKAVAPQPDHQFAGAAGPGKEIAHALSRRSDPVEGAVVDRQQVGGDCRMQCVVRPGSRPEIGDAVRAVSRRRRIVGLGDVDNEAQVAQHLDQGAARLAAFYGDDGYTVHRRPPRSCGRAVHCHLRP